MIAKESCVAGFIHGAGCQGRNGLCRFDVRGDDDISVQFDEQDASHDTGASLAVDARMVLHQPGCERCCRINHAGGGVVSLPLPGGRTPCH
jgi:hypothetical protein